MSPIHHEWGPHTSSHARVQYEVPAKLQSPTGQALGPKKTSVPPAPQTRRLRVLDQCRALRPSVDLVRTAAGASAHSAVPPARLRAVSTGNQYTDPTYPVSSQRPTAMATVHRASRSGPRAQDRNTGQARPGRKKREQAEKSSWGALTESLLEGGSGKYELLSIKLGPLHKTDRGAAGEHVDPGPEETYAGFQAVRAFIFAWMTAPPQSYGAAGLQEDPPVGVSGAPSENNIMQWNAVIFGPEGTPFEDGTFKLVIEFSEEYPNKPPTVRFLSKMFHPNVYADGSICLDILQNRWSPTYDVSSILTSIQSLLDEPNPNSPANSQAAQLYQENKREYEKRVSAIVEQSWNDS
ncbi:hypothetical protein J1605_014766 [Eschrichtius robustus]|uniref:E2 ubiquitin-conjugating enzyme n=1 Tax=Eschrichtius robustus TaxID=9764 RepID=A0AB34GE22_ESCRO|nr:hypothetical protein J1605_014766 [Eschrichtius robustus]